MTWEEFNDPETNPIESSTLVMASEFFSTMGIESTNIIVDFWLLKNTATNNIKQFQFSNRALMRAVAHLTLLIDVSEASREEINQFKKKTKKFSKVKDLRNKTS